jgi:hypothetical protein
LRFLTDDAALEIRLELDTEPEDLDLTAAGLGEQLLNVALEGMLGAHEKAESPEGTPWPELAASTVRQKGHATIGYHTGRTHLLDPQRWQTAPRDITTRSASWTYPNDATRGQAQGWQQGNERNRMPARRIVGWTEHAQEECRRQVAEAIHELDPGGEIR